MPTVYFRKAGVFEGERPIDTLPLLMTAAAEQELAERAALIDLAYGKFDSNNQTPGVR